MLRKPPAVAVFSALLLAGCGARQTKPVEDLSGSQATAEYALTSLKGTRDGERVAVRAVYGDGSRRLTLDLQFRLTPQAKLESGTWAGAAGEGAVRERSVTFLGGQSGPPSIGGRFDLIGSRDRAVYRVNLPLQPLNDPL